MPTTAPEPEALPEDSSEYLRRQWAGLLRVICLAQADRDAYVALTVETGLTAHDCLLLAMLDREDGRAQEALAWVEQGAELCRENSRDTTSESDTPSMPVAGRT